MQKLIDQVIDFANKQKRFANTEFTKFVENFYLENGARDFEGYKIEDLYNYAASSFEFFLEKKQHHFKIRAYNPHLSENKFESHYTVIDIVNDDMPFLVDSVVAHLDKYRIKIANVIHPIYSLSRDEKGAVKKIEEKSANKESVIQLHIEKISSKSELKILEENISKILRTAAIVVEDWKKMVDCVKKAQDQLDNAKKIISAAEISEIKDFLSWIADGNFILLGVKEFDIKLSKEKKNELVEVDNSSFGVFRAKDEDMRPTVLNSSFEEVCESVSNPFVIEILKSRYRSRIHRVANAERVRIQKISNDGKVVGEFRLIGLFTSSVYHETISKIPLVRNKVEAVVKNSHYSKSSHNYKDLVSVLESYPRDELFQISQEDLLKNATGIVAICGRSQVRFFARKDKLNRFVSCLVFTPRDNSNSDLRDKIKDYLANIYNGEIADSFVQITESNLVRFHVIVRTSSGVIPQINESEVERDITSMTKVWSDDLRDAIKAKFDEAIWMKLFAKYKNAFSVSYVNRFDSRRAAIDIVKIEECLEQNSVLFNLYKSSSEPSGEIAELKIYSPSQELILSSIMPVLESFGFNIIQEHTYVVTAEIDEKNRSKTNVWVHYFRLNLSKSGDQFSEKIKLNFEKSISLIWQKTVKHGALNRLVVAADLSWKQIYILSAYSKYLYQSGFRFTENYIAEALVKYRDISKLLVRLFETKFNPSLDLNKKTREAEIKSISSQIESALNNVKDASDDAVIRRFLAVINATLRTNYYQSNKDGAFKGYVSLKFDCKKIPELPLPIPHAEIFVYSSSVEAIHLRGGKVARGGLRWSDRHEDFRTEVLGLMKAQMTKNAVIVPVGSKGGFVVKRDLSGLTRDEIQQEGIQCYKTFLSGLLDITDNVIEGKIKHPNHCVLYDGTDPYLVVAADKGTATFSDIANSVSADYNFWLGDAFASGGSVGYDHKKMGITAKGAWISVKRHFREIGIDTQSQDFTCAGIGDLAGDVFGNGMLLSKHIKLVAAFNHLHIFLDPNPDAAKSFVERERMFNLPRSNWTDYDKSLISKGGGIFERSAKSIKISPEVKSVLGIEGEDELTPNELIKAILKSPVDLLWNGGIGTYVKATDESHQDASDRANDLLRINGNELRCKVVGEGGNLGFTQKGRIEYAISGGKINTDAMDNSAGVDCSDHEVNIKIALQSALTSKKITLSERNKVLESMTDEVSDLVLSDNHLQTQAISIAHLRGVSAIGDQSQFLDKLEKSGLLNRKIEFLPSRKEIDKRQSDKIGLTRPELCVMLAYAKMDIYNAILSTSLVEDKYFESELLSYFPKLMQKEFAEEIKNHQLRKEIIATQITNFVVNRGGITLVSQISQDSGFDIANVVRSFVIACDSFSLRKIWEEIEASSGKVSSEVQMQMFLAASKLLERSVLWLLRNNHKKDITSTVARFSKIANQLQDILPSSLAVASKESFERKIQTYSANKVDIKLANKIASLDPIASAFDIAAISEASDFDLETIAKIYFAVGTRFSLKWMRSKVSTLSFDNYWQKLASKTIVEDLYNYQMRIAKNIVEFSCDNKSVCDIDALEKWTQKAGFLIERFDNFISDLNASGEDVSMFVIALNRIKALAYFGAGAK